MYVNVAVTNDAENAFLPTTKPLTITGTLNNAVEHGNVVREYSVERQYNQKWSSWTQIAISM